MLNNEQIQALRNALLDLTAMGDFDVEQAAEAQRKVNEELKQAAKESVLELQQAFPAVWEEEGHDA